MTARRRDQPIHTVSASLRSAGPARGLIETLEEQGTPPNAIDLIDPEAVKYASPAWREARHTGEPELVTVTVQHPDASVVDRAEDIFSRHDEVVSVRRAEI